MKVVNNSNTSMSVALWLASDGYDLSGAIPDNLISATALLKPVRATILSRRAQAQGMEKVADVADLVPSRLGHAFHDSVEQAWKSDDRVKNLQKLGIPKRVAEKVHVNPSKEYLEENPDTIPIYMEIRSRKEIEGYTVSGKFDFVADGRVEDFKSTSTFSYTMGNKDEDYRLQGSIYKWLNPDIITEDHMAIQFLFTDWSAKLAKAGKGYPQNRVLEHRIKLLTVEETEEFIRDRVKTIERYRLSPEDELPLCTDKELWRSAPTYKYYADPTKLIRSTRNFKDRDEAMKFKATKGKGIVVEAGGEVKACAYCPAFNLCTQKDRYLLDGSLKL